MWSKEELTNQVRALEAKNEVLEARNKTLQRVIATSVGLSMSEEEFDRMFPDFDKIADAITAASVLRPKVDLNASKIYSALSNARDQVKVLGRSTDLVNVAILNDIDEAIAHLIEAHPEATVPTPLARKK